jgi:hypothetical protein
MRLMKYLLLPLWLALAASAPAAGLAFTETLKEVQAAAEAETVAIEFPFHNTSEKPITVTKADAGCSCMNVLFSGGKMTYAPGESGALRAIFKLGQFSGTVNQTISLWLDTDPKKPASQTVKARIQIPMILTMEPRTLKWSTSEGRAEPQTIQIRVAEGKIIHVTGAKPLTEQFSTDLKVLEDGRSYDLIVTPRDASAQGVSVIQIETDSDIPKLRTQRAYAMVKPPMPTDKSTTAEISGPAHAAAGN